MYLGYLEILKRGAHLLGNLGNSPDFVLFAAQPTDQREESVVLLLVVIVVVGGGQFFSLPCTVFWGVKRQKLWLQKGVKRQILWLKRGVKSKKTLSQ